MNGWRLKKLMGIGTLLFMLGCGPDLGSQTPTPEADLLIRAARIVDPRTDQVSQPKDILIAQSLIIEVEDGGTILPSRAKQTIEAEDLFLLPGLIDVHAHIGDGGLGLQTDKDRRDAFRQFLRYGVTTIFVPGGGGGNDDQLAAWKAERKTGGLISPDLYGSGAIITAPGSHPIGTLWDMPEDVDPALAYARGAVALAEEDPVAPLLEWKKDKGVDAIKIVIEDGPGPWVPKPRLSVEKVRQVVKEAHAKNLSVFAHISMRKHLEDAVAAGVDGVMHSSEEPFGPDLANQMAAKGIFYVPTLSLYDGFFKRALGDSALEPYALAGISERAKASLDRPEWWAQPEDPPEWLEPTKQALAENLVRCVEHGIPIALGTDVNNPTVFPGYSAHEELTLMVEAGLTPANALSAATENAALFLKRPNLGRVEKGFEADLILLEKNPLANINHTRTIRLVVSDGTVFDDVVSLSGDEN